MLLSHVHAQFWLKHRAPDFIVKAMGKQDAGIDGCVNAHAKRPAWDEKHHAGNLLALLRSVRRRGENMLQYLERIAAAPGTLIRPERRAGYARKWASRLRQPR